MESVAFAGKPQLLRKLRGLCVAGDGQEVYGNQRGVREEGFIQLLPVGNRRHIDSADSSVNMEPDVVGLEPVAVTQGQSLRYLVVVSRLLNRAQNQVRIGKAYRVGRLSTSVINRLGGEGFVRAGRHDAAHGRSLQPELPATGFVLKLQPSAKRVVVPGIFATATGGRQRRRERSSAC